MEPRHYTNLLIDKIENDELDKDEVITALLNWMPEDEVKDCCIQEGLLEEEKEDDE